MGKKLETKLKEAGLFAPEGPIFEATEDGAISANTMSPEEKDTLADIVGLHFRPDEYPAEKRLVAYREAFTIDEFIEAYMEATFEERPEKLASIQAKRAKIKAAGSL